MSLRRRNTSVEADHKRIGSEFTPKSLTRAAAMRGVDEAFLVPIIVELRARAAVGLVAAIGLVAEVKALAATLDAEAAQAAAWRVAAELARECLARTADWRLITLPSTNYFL